MKIAERRIERSDAGLSLVELMFTSGIMIIGLVMLLGAMVTLAGQSQVAEIRVNCINFNTSILETMRGLGIDRILIFNRDGDDLGTDINGVVEIAGLEGFGTASVTIEAVIPPDGLGGAQTFIQIPTSIAGLDLSTFPNPIEVRITTKLDRGDGAGNEYQFVTSSLLFYL